ncbi:MAG: hypothetical protein M1450_00605 [Patescibacteria group bacterium]|nr:hypothetical protein [Patescibacteria group bacterium]
MAKSDYVTASEIAEYIYCKCCWWDRLEGLKGTNILMEEGSKSHVDLSNKIDFFEKLKRLAIFLILVSILLLAITLFLLFNFHLI